MVLTLFLPWTSTAELLRGSCHEKSLSSFRCHAWNHTCHWRDRQDRQSLRLAELQTRAALQLGAFTVSLGDTLGPEFRARPGRPADRIFVSCGMYESLIYENRSLVPLLQSTGMDVRYVEARDGHNWENWRDRLRTAFSWLFPGPLWMVYE